MKDSSVAAICVVALVFISGLIIILDSITSKDVRIVNVPRNTETLTPKTDDGKLRDFSRSFPAA